MASSNYNEEGATCTIIRGFVSPSGAGVDPTTGHIAIAEFSCVTWLDKDSFQVIRRAGKQDATGIKDGKVAEARFQKCSAVTFDDLGHAVVTDNCRVRMLSFDGHVVTWAGKTPGCKNGPAASALFGPLCGISMGSSGLWYVADHDNHMIRRLTSKGNVVTVAGAAQRGCKDGAKGEARFSNPSGIALGLDKSVYVCDSGNHCIRKIDQQGNVTTYAGVPCTPGSDDGDRFTAKFSKPYGIAADPSGTLYITEHGQNAVRVISPQGVVGTLLSPTAPLVAEGESGVEAVTLRHLGHPIVTSRYQLIVPDVWLGALLIFDLDHPDVPRELQQQTAPPPLVLPQDSRLRTGPSSRYSGSTPLLPSAQQQLLDEDAALDDPMRSSYESHLRRNISTPALVGGGGAAAGGHAPDGGEHDGASDPNMAKVEAWIEHQQMLMEAPSLDHNPPSFDHLLLPAPYAASESPRGSTHPSATHRPPTPSTINAQVSPTAPRGDHANSTGDNDSVNHHGPGATTSNIDSPQLTSPLSSPPAPHPPTPMNSTNHPRRPTPTQTTPVSSTTIISPKGRSSLFNRILSSQAPATPPAPEAPSPPPADAKPPRDQGKGFRRPRRKSSDMSEYTINDTPRVVVPPARLSSKTQMAAVVVEGQEAKPKKKKGALKRLLCGFMN